MKIKSVLVLLLLQVHICGAQSEDQPNILVIHVDDMGYHDLSITGSEIYQTPAIDGLADSGVSFTNAYANYPRCVPSRYAMITGTYPVSENKGKLHKMPNSQNFVYQFNQLGYRTGYIGKWHLGVDKSSPAGIGFDFSYAAGEAGGTGSRFYPFNTRKNKKGDKASIENVEQDAGEGDYLSDVLTDATIDFMKSGDGQEPFFAMLAFYAVHTPIEAKEEDIARNKAEIDLYDFGDTPEYIEEGTGRRKMRQDDPAYAGMVENVDENVAKLLTTLDQMGIRENTIVIFSSDHGGLSNDGENTRHLATTNNPLKAGKGWLNEGGIRVPLFISWPGTIKPSVDDKSIVAGMDIFTSVLHLVSGNPLAGVDGKSLVPVIQGKESWDDRSMYWHSSKARPHSTGDSAASAIRVGDYKLIQYLDDGSYELYNLKNDVGEEVDLSEQMPEKVEDLLSKLSEWKNKYKVKDNRKPSEKAKAARKKANAPRKKKKNK